MNRRYLYSSSDTDELDTIIRFEDTAENAEVRLYVDNKTGHLDECIKVWYPSSNYENFKPTAYMLDVVKERVAV